MTAADLPAVDELFGLPPGEFVAARDALSKELRQGGDRAEAAEVKKLRRPTVAAWALNQLARRHADDVGALVDQGRALAEAQERALTGSAAELREASRARRDTLRFLAEAVDRILAEHSAGDHHQEVVATLTAASLDPASGEELLGGRLSDALPAPAGFGMFGGFELPDEPDTEPDAEAVGAEEADGPQSDREAEPGSDVAEGVQDDQADDELGADAAEDAPEGEAEQARRDAEAATEQAQAEAEAARQDAERAAGEAAEAATRAKEARRRVRQLEGELEAARQDADQATREADDAEAAAEEARTAADEATARADDGRRS